MLTKANTRTYDATVWGILSAVLFATTLLVPLVGPAVLRYFVQMIYRHRHKLRIWCLIGALIYFIVVYWVVPIILWKLAGDELYIWYYNDFDYSFNNINMVSFLLSAAVMGVLCIGNIVVSIRSTSKLSRKTRVIKWTFFVIVLIVTYLFDVFSDYDFDWLDYGDGSGYLASGFAVSTIVP